MEYGLQLKPRGLQSVTAGRLGRVSYIAYSLGTVLVLAILMGVTTYLALSLPVAAGQLLLSIAALLNYYLLLPLMMGVLTIRRAHDFNYRGWLALLLLVPVINLLFWVIPGTTGGNNYGEAPAAYTLSTLLVAFILPLLLLGGYFAAGTSVAQSPKKFIAAPFVPNNLRQYKP